MVDYIGLYFPQPGQKALLTKHCITRFTDPFHWKISTHYSFLLIFLYSPSNTHAVLSRMICNASLTDRKQKHEWYCYLSVYHCYPVLSDLAHCFPASSWIRPTYFHFQTLSVLPFLYSLLNATQTLNYWQQAICSRLLQCLKTLSWFP